MEVNDDYVEVTEKALATLRKLMFDIDKLCAEGAPNLSTNIRKLFEETGMYKK